MRLVLAILFVAFSSSPALARDKEDNQAVRRCLELWGDKNPWKGKDGTPKYKTISATTKVMGFGDGIEDKQKTDDPELVLVKPTVAVMSKNTVRLLNPNGWYCLKSNVTVMAETVLEIGCSSNLADAQSGVAVLGDNEESKGSGVTVMGKTKLKRVGCKKKGR